MIRKDVNDALNNLKKDSPKKPEEKHTKSKFDDMSPDELLNEINSGKTAKSGAKKLKRISPDAQRKAPEPSGKKRIVIGELPDYDALAEQENPTPEENTKPEEKTEKKEENKKGFFSRVRDLMYVSEDDDEENPVEEPEAEETPEDDGNFTVEEIEEESTPETIETVSEEPAAVNDGVPENESEKPSEEPEKVPEKKPENNSGRRKKKKKKKNNNNNSKNKPEVKSEKPSESEPEVKPEETVITEPEETVITEPEETVITEPEETVVTEPEETVITEPEETEQEEEVTEKTEKPKKTYPAENKAKYSILGLVCVILAVVGVIAIINACISNSGGGKSSKEKFAKAVYPAVIMDINSFDSPSQLPNDQILSAAIWSVVLDKNKLSKYDERMGVVIIPAVDIENFAVELFGEDIPQLNHTTVGPVESKFYYNADTQSYNIQVKPSTFTYAPEVTSVSKDSGNYIVDVEYVEEQPEWMEKSVSKSVEFSLAKNSSGGYKINSMKVLSGGQAE